MTWNWVVLGKTTLYVGMRFSAPCLLLLFVLTVYDGKDTLGFMTCFLGHTIFCR